jgi:hypothetical protein
LSLVTRGSSVRVSERLRESRIPDWVAGIADHVPLAGNGAEVLAEGARLSSRLRAIDERGHPRDVDIGTVVFSPSKTL